MLVDATEARDGAPTISWISTAEVDRVVGSIESPAARTRAFATLCRINTLAMIMHAGSGHLGSSFSAADIVAHLYLHELREPQDAEGDVYFSSKGHDVPGLYAALIALGHLPEKMLTTLRRLGGLPGHPDVGLPGIPFNTGSLGMGISKAKGLILADRLRGVDRRVFVMLGDGELQEGQVWESLAGAVSARMSELTAIVDHNKLQSDTWVRDVSDLGDLEAKFASFGWATLRCDGNDAEVIAETFARRARLVDPGPAVIIADTVKGAGSTIFAATAMPSDEWRYRFHSGAPSPADFMAAQGELLATVEATLAETGLEPLAVSPAALPARASATGERLVDAYAAELVTRAAADPRIVVLDADLVLDTGLIPFRTRFPDRFVECGIAEQDMVSTAGGLAAGGRLPFAHSFSCFLHARPNEQIYNNATEGRRVVYVGWLAGLLPAAPGHSHQAVRDVSALAAVPGLLILEPTNAAELRTALDFCQDADESVYLRMSSMPVPDRATAVGAEPLHPGRGRVVRPGGRLLAIGAGPQVVAHLLEVADLLDPDGTDVTVAVLPWLNHVDASWLEEVAADVEHVVVVEHHYTRGGQADRVARALLESDRVHPTFQGIGLIEVPACGTPDEVLSHHGLAVPDLVEAIRDRRATAPPSRRSTSA